MGELTCIAAQMRDGTTVVVDAPDMFPSNLSQVEVFYEPTVNGTLICPSEHLGKMISLCEVCACGFVVLRQYFC